MTFHHPATAEEPTVSAETAAETTASPRFAELGLDSRVMAAVEQMGYETPSPVQAETIPHLVAGRDVVGLAQTGTGKTAAFALPALSHMAGAHDAGELGSVPNTLVLAPTRELAIQVAEAFTGYASHVDGVTVLPIYGGAPYGPQLHGLRRGANVVVGTPGRVIDHMTKGSLDLGEIRHLILDEADEMLRMGFAEEVDKILAQTPEDKQVALFSATMPTAIRRISEQYLKDPVEVSVKAKTTTSANTRQRFVSIKHHAKPEALTRIMETEPQLVSGEGAAIVFVRTRSATEEVAAKLSSRGFRATAINGDIPQNLREKTVEQLKSGRVDVLVATDVAARGLDVERISHVFNYDIPMDTESYVHRIGRTGRAGRTGDAILFVTPREKRMLRSIEKATRQPVEQMALPSLSDVNASRLQRFSERITATLASEDLDEYRDLVTGYVAEHDTPAEDVAAALVAMVHEGRPLLLDAEGEDELLRDSQREYGQDNGGRGERGERGPRGRKERGAGAAPTADAGNAIYKIAVGKKDGVNPGHIVGAITGEANLRGNQVGSINIYPTFSLVELPESLSPQQWEMLGKARVGGRALRIERDAGPHGTGGKKHDDGFRGNRGKGGFKKSEKKPRWSRG